MHFKMLFPFCLIIAVITWIFFPFMDCFFVGFKTLYWHDFLIALMYRNICLPLSCVTWNYDFLLFLYHTVEIYPVEPQCVLILKFIIAMITWISYTCIDSVFVSELLARACGVPAAGVWAVDCWQWHIGHYFHQSFPPPPLQFFPFPPSRPFFIDGVLW